MRIVKFLFKSILVLILLVVIAMIAIPYFFKDEIVETIKTQVNDNLNATIDFESVDISLFKSFPDLYLGLNDLKITGVEEFEGVELLKTESLSTSLNIMSVIKEDRPIVINDIQLNSPNINVVTLANGSSNYDIAKANETTNNTDPIKTVFDIKLQQYAINHAIISYNDKVSNIELLIEDLNHSGNGDFTETLFDLKTNTNIKMLSLNMNEIQYFKNARAQYDAIIKMNMDEMKFTLSENELSINALKLAAEGWLKINDNDMEMDLKFKAPSNDFKELLSVIPNAFIKGYEDVKASGRFSFLSNVKGVFNGDENIFPSFNMELNVKEAELKYPDLPMAIKSINTNIKVNSPSSDFDKIVVDASRFSFDLGDNPFSGKLYLTRPISDPNVKAKMKGTINFEDLSKAFPMDGVSSLKGVLDTDMKIAALMSDIEREDYDNVNAEGYFNLKNFVYQSDEMPKVTISNLASNITPKSIQIDNMKANFGKTDVDITGNIKNYLAYFSPQKTMTGSINLKSQKVDFNEWMSEPNDKEPTETASVEEEVFDRFDFIFTGDVKEIYYEDFILKNNITRGQISSNKFVLDRYQMEIGKSDFEFNGQIDNMFNYLFKNEVLGGKLNLRSDLLDMNEMMGAEVDPNSESGIINEAAFPVPANIDMTINANLSKVFYTNMEFGDMKGQVIIKDEKASIQNFVSNTLNGKIEMNGSYDSKDKEDPAFDLNYKFLKIDFKQAFSTFNTVAKIAPIGKFMRGSFNTEMTMNGTLGKDMMPNLMSINADGFLQTFNSILTNFLPLKSVAEKLNVNELKNMTIKDVKTWFTFEDGRIAVKEFPYKWKGIDMKIKGGHSLDNSMDYVINMKIPRDMIKNKGVNELTDKGLGLLTSQASKIGLNIKEAKFINVAAEMTGSIISPKVKIRLVGTDGKAVSLVEKAKEEVTKVVKQVKDSVETVVKETVEDKKKELKEKADKEIAALMKKAKESSSKVKKEGYRLAEEARKVGYQKADLLVKEAGNNPLKKFAAQKAAKLLKKQTDKKADQMKRETDKRADQVMTRAEKEADKIRKKYE